MIIAGSRDIYLDIGTVQDIIDVAIPNDIEITEIISGTCRGVDQSGERWSEVQGTPLKRFKSDWKKYGSAAGPIRNAEMAEYADALLLIWNGESKGSANMRYEIGRLNKPIYEVIFKTHNQGENK